VTLKFAWWRIRRALVVSGGRMWLGFVLMGCFLGMALSADDFEGVVTELSFLKGLPPGHPERSVAQLPPTESEAELWEQLGLLGDTV